MRALIQSIKDAYTRLSDKRRQDEVDRGFAWASAELTRNGEGALGYMDMYVFHNEPFGEGVVQAVQTAYNRGWISTTRLGPVQPDRGMSIRAARGLSQCL